MQPAKRLQGIPPYLFAELDRKKAEVTERGIDVLSLGIGDPDQPSPPWVVEALQREAARPENHRYPMYEGLPEFRGAVAEYYQRRFGVSLNPKSEIISTIGSKEGIAHLIWALVDPGDVVLCPDPSYPVYEVHTRLVGGEVQSMPLVAERQFLPDLDAVPEAVLRRTKLLFLNYPNNPTGAVATRELFERAVALARRFDFLVVNDAAYIEMVYGEPQPSILEVEGAGDVACEFYSLSKPFNMTGWRLAAMVGAEPAVSALGLVKNNTDSGQFNAIQAAGTVALQRQPQAFFEQMNALYKERRDLLLSGLSLLGWDIEPPPATFYVWAKVPFGTSASFAETLLTRSGVLVVPGSGYGRAGEGYVRLCLTLGTEKIEQVLDRLKALGEGFFAGEAKDLKS